MPAIESFAVHVGCHDALLIRMQTPGYGDDCCLCGGDASGFHAVPIWNGDELVSNDWPGEWAGKPSCESCYLKHERGELPMLTAEDWRRWYAPGFCQGDGI